MAELKPCPIHHALPVSWYEDGAIHVECVEEACKLSQASGGDYAEASEDWNRICALETDVDQLEYLADIAEEHWREMSPDSNHWHPALAAARERVRLMRTPINSESIKAAGFLFQGLGTFVSLDAPVTLKTDEEGTSWSVRHGTRLMPNVESIWDLLELVRMAGGRRVTA